MSEIPHIDLESLSTDQLRNLADSLRQRGQEQSAARLQEEIDGRAARFGLRRPTASPDAYALRPTRPATSPRKARRHGVVAVGVMALGAAAIGAMVWMSPDSLLGWQALPLQWAQRIGLSIPAPVAEARRDAPTEAPSGQSPAPLAAPVEKSGETPGEAPVRLSVLRLEAGATDESDQPDSPRPQPPALRPRIVEPSSGPAAPTPDR